MGSVWEACRKCLGSTQETCRECAGSVGRSCIGSGWECTGWHAESWLKDFFGKVVPRGLEPRTLQLLAVRSNQLSYETDVKEELAHFLRSLLLLRLLVGP